MLDRWGKPARQAYGVGEYVDCDPEPGVEVITRVYGAIAEQRLMLFRFGISTYPLCVLGKRGVGEAVTF